MAVMVVLILVIVVLILFVMYNLIMLAAYVFSIIFGVSTIKKKKKISGIWIALSLGIAILMTIAEGGFFIYIAANS